MAAMVRKLLFDGYLLLGVGGGLLLVSALGWLAFGQQNPPSCTHQHCPVCLREFPYVAALEGKSCPSCHKEGTRLVATVGSRTRGGYRPDQKRKGRIVLFAAIAVIVTQGEVFLFLWRLRAVRRLQELEAERRFVCLCPFCGRRLNYPVRKGGTGAICPFCKTGFLLPAPDDAGEAETRGATSSWL